MRDHAPWQGYAAALALAAAAWLLRAALTPLVGPTAVPFITFFPAIAAVAWYGGLGPACLAIAIALFAADWSFMPPLHVLSAPSVYDVAAFTAFVVASGCIVAPIEALRRSRIQVQQSEAAIVVDRDRLETT